MVFTVGSVHATNLDCVDIRLLDVVSDGKSGLKQAVFELVSHCEDNGFNIEVGLRTSPGSMPPKWSFPVKTQLNYLSSTQNKPSQVSIDYHPEGVKLLRVYVKHKQTLWAETIIPVE